MRVFTKTATRVSSMQIVFKCMLCHPDLLPTQRQRYQCFGPNAERLEERLDEEFQLMISTIKKRAADEEAALVTAAATAAAAAGEVSPDQSDEDSELSLIFFYNSRARGLHQKIV